MGIGLDRRGNIDFDRGERTSNTISVFIGRPSRTNSTNRQAQGTMPNYGHWTYPPPREEGRGCERFSIRMHCFLGIQKC